MCNCNTCNSCGCNSGCGICNSISRALRNLFDANALCNSCNRCNSCGCNGNRSSRSGCGCNSGCGCGCNSNRSSRSGCGCNNNNCGDYDDYYARQYALYPYNTASRCGCGCNN